MNWRRLLSPDSELAELRDRVVELTVDLSSCRAELVKTKQDLEWAKSACQVLDKQRRHAIEAFRMADERATNTEQFLAVLQGEQLP